MLYSRPGCDHCEALEDELHQSFRGRYRLDWRNVDRDAASREHYGERIPVLTDLAGRVLSVGQLDQAQLTAYLDEASAHSDSCED